MNAILIFLCILTTTIIICFCWIERSGNSLNDVTNNFNKYYTGLLLTPRLKYFFLFSYSNKICFKVSKEGAISSCTVRFHKLYHQPLPYNQTIFNGSLLYFFIYLLCLLLLKKYCSLDVLQKLWNLIKLPFLLILITAYALHFRTYRNAENSKKWHAGPAANCSWRTTCGCGTASYWRNPVSPLSSRWSFA